MLMKKKIKKINKSYNVNNYLTQNILKKLDYNFKFMSLFLNTSLIRTKKIKKKKKYKKKKYSKYFLRIKKYSIKPTKNLYLNCWFSKYDLSPSNKELFYKNKIRSYTNNYSIDNLINDLNIIYGNIAKKIINFKRSFFSRKKSNKNNRLKIRKIFLKYKKIKVKIKKIYIHNNYNNVYNISNLYNKPLLINRFFITKKTLEDLILKFHYKRINNYVKLCKIINKPNKNKFYWLNVNFMFNLYSATEINPIKKYIFNMHKNKLKTYRDARIIHWNLYTKKTLRENRYRLFLNKQLNKEKKLNVYYLLNLKLYLPWTFWENLIKLFFIKYIKTNTLEINKIYQLPSNKAFWKLLYFFKLKQKKLKKKIKKWSYKNYQKQFYFWKERKKKNPKNFEQINPTHKKFYNTIQYDFITNSFIILNNNYIKINYNDKYQTNNNMLLKLYNFRYKA